MSLKENDGGNFVSAKVLDQQLAAGVLDCRKRRRGGRDASVKEKLLLLRAGGGVDPEGRGCRFTRRVVAVRGTFTNELGCKVRGDRHVVPGDGSVLAQFA